MHESRLKYESGLECEVHLGGPVGLIELKGSLRPDTVLRLREVVLKRIVERPDVIVLDLACLEDREGLGARVFPELSVVAAEANGELILAAPSPSVRQAMRTVDPLFLRMFDTLGEAMEAAESGPAHRRCIHALSADAYAARSARQVIDDMCRRWQLTELREQALVVVSELVNNAAEHGRAPIELRSTIHPRALRIEVTDQGNAMPNNHHTPPDDALHNGLRLVDALARNWGTVSTTRGKTVWADLLIHPARCLDPAVR